MLRQDSIIETIIEGYIEDTRSRGRLQLRYINQVMQHRMQQL